MHTERRTESVDKIVIHVNQGPDTQGGARSLARYLAYIDGGYHEVGDNADTIITAADNIVVWGASGMNQRGWHYCIIGDANQTAAQWDDPYSHAAVDLGARRCAIAAQRLNIPTRWLSVTEVATYGVKGFCTHDDVSRAFGGDHYDPGPHFPKDRFMAVVVAGTVPAPVPTPTWKVPPMYNPPLQVVAVLKNENHNVVAGLSPDGHVFAWGIPFDHAHHERSQPYGNKYFTGRSAAKIEWPNDKEKAAGYAYVVIATSGERYGQSAGLS